MNIANFKEQRVQLETMIYSGSHPKLKTADLEPEEVLRRILQDSPL